MRPVRRWWPAPAAGTTTSSLMAPQIRIRTSSPEETQRLGRAIGEQARAGDVYLLVGPLGAGKTCLTQGIAWGLGVEGYTRSPTFVLMTRYQGRLTLYHLDLYRIDHAQEAWDLGLEEQLYGDGVCVVEWADRAEEVFPQDSLWISLDYARDYALDRALDYEGEDTVRVITIADDPPRYEPLLKNLSQTFTGVEEVHP